MHQLRKATFVLAATTFLSLFACWPAGAAPLSGVIQGVAVTGLNRLMGQPLRDFGPPLGTFGFSTVAAYNPDGTAPLPLSLDAPPSTLLATVADPGILAVLGVDPGLVPASFLNIPLLEVPANVDPAGHERQALPPQLQAPPLAPSQAEPAAPITLAAWLQATGQATILCPNDGPATVDLEARGLLPNRLYTVWAAFATPEGPVAVPLGGAPNAFVTDGEGRGRLARLLNFCPFETLPGGGRLLVLEVVFHSDNMLYAFEPTLPAAGLPPGVVVHDQLEFPVSGEPLR